MGDSLQSLNELRKLRVHFPELWKQMLKWDKTRPKHNRGYIKYDTVHDLDRRFAFEEKLANLGVPEKLQRQWSCKHKEIVRQ